MHLIMCILVIHIIFHYVCIGMAERPTFQELYAFPSESTTVNVIEGMGTKYFQTGSILLEDNDGSKMEGIIDQCREDAVKINRQILRKWIGGEGKQPVNWATLVTVLNTCGLTELAKAL